MLPNQWPRLILSQSVTGLLKEAAFVPLCRLSDDNNTRTKQFMQWKGLLSFRAFCWPDCKPEGPLFLAELSVCLCVSVCVSLTGSSIGTSTLQR